MLKSTINGLIFTVTFLAMPMLVSETASAADCAKTPDPEAKVHCLARPGDLRSPNWRITETVDVLTDQKEVIVRTTDVRRSGITLFIRCQQGEPNPIVQKHYIELYIYFSGEYMSDHDGGGIVQIRFDQKTSMSRKFDESSNGKALFYGFSEDSSQT